jgi:serine/threonine protein phosphatase PrpC
MAENYFGITDKGKQRGNNEDTFIAQPVAGSNLIIACVIDGVGGYEGGEVAASIAHDTIIKTLNSSSANLPEDLAEAFKLANDEIYKEKQAVKQRQSMACVATLAVVDIVKNQFYYAHVGDTRIYLFRDKSLVKVSSDHSFVGFLEDSGRLTEEAAMNHPKRNEINKALGFEHEIVSEKGYIETGNSPFLPGDLLLLCSDGLTDMVSSQEITAVLSGDGSLEAKGKKLIDSANHNGGRDNITVVLVQNNKTGAKPQAVMPPPEQKLKWQTVPKAGSPKNREKSRDIAETAAPVKKRHNGWLIFLAILCIVLTAANGYQYLQYNAGNHPSASAPDTTVSPAVKTRPQGAAEKALRDTIKKFSSKDTSFIKASVFKSPVVISATLNLDKDSLYIKGKGEVVLKCDSGYHGPAFKVNPKCKNLVIDNLVFDGFDTAFTYNNDAVKFKHVKFINCKVPVQALITAMPSQFVTGKLNSQPFKPDTTAKKIKK